MSGENTAWAERSNNVIVGNYGRYPATMVKGEGCVLTDANGKEYLDCLAGIAVCSLGHCHPKVTEAICTQAQKLIHISNLYNSQPQIELAELLVANSFADQVFFANSGAEANEAAIKLARIASGPERYGVISLAGSFHGRTLATVAATGQPAFHEGFEPMPEGFSHAPFANLNVLEAMITDQTCAILCEPLQGEGGVRPLDNEYLQGIQDLCRKHNLFLIFDEIQTGIGRTGSFFAYEQLGVVPDIMTVAKALGSGLPIGAMLTRKEIAVALKPGTHGSTFGGNPVATAAAVATVNIILEDGFLAAVQEKGEYLRKGLDDLASRFPKLATGARGMGLLCGLVLTEKGIEQGAAMVKSLFDRGVLINFAGNAVLRFLPPLIITTDEIDQLLTALGEVLGECEV
jgi:acetylornithine aminotransferase/acetylornithine/N-succinyldiaminopimelate aminotransferase